ncbi:hypothetical protein Y1Q_0012464 [Alligator mississippiensis]|uniref:Uncharacterized protein n=1 Tax=Alligator mississippiensis TaxID=8496 RepID=A0A151M7U0_ALLMI|nr:hypothetical protein Y1Q_0012464 [Alligator mississippiensis]
MHIVTRQPEEQLLQWPGLQVAAHSTCSLNHFWALEGILTSGNLKGAVDGQRQGGRPRTSWTTNIKYWMGLKLTDCTRIAKDREEWRKSIDTSKAVGVASGLT